MSEKISVNIIGSGAGGLFAGAILAKHGFDVNIYEARVNIGGYTSGWKRKDYFFESSVHEINGFFPEDPRLRVFRYLGLFDRLNLCRIESPYTSVFKDYEFKLGHGPDIIRDKLINEFPEDSKEITRIFKYMRDVSFELSDYLKEENEFKAIMKVPFKYKNIFKGFIKNTYDLLKNLKNPRVRTIIGQLFHYYSSNLRKLNLIFFAFPTYQYMYDSFWFSGTSKSFSDTLRDLIVENGGKIHTHKKVTKILFEKKKAVGIEVNDSERYYSDITLSNAPLLATFSKLIDKKEISSALRNKALKTKFSTSIFTIYLGVDIDVRDIGIKEYCYFLNKTEDIVELVSKKDVHVPHEDRTVVLTSFFLDNSLTPEGKTVMNICTIDDMKYWEPFKKDKVAYKKEKLRIANLLLDRIEERFPGLKDHIEVMEIGTPYTMEKFSNNPGGAVYGGAQNFAQTNIFRFPNAIPKKNLYFAGAWVKPGGGVSGAITASIITSKMIMEKYGIKNEFDAFASPAPEEYPEEYR